MEQDICVLVHGFTGSPEELEPLAETLQNAGYEVHVPILYGHGDGKEDLRLATASTWIQSVQPIVEEALERGRVHLIGFSMGAMICSVIAAKYPVSSVTMLSPAVFYIGPRQMFRQIAGVIKESWDGRELDSTYVRKRIDKISNTPLRSVKQFRRMVQLGKAALPQVSAPLCVIQGEKDEIVEPRSASYVCTKAGSSAKELHFLPASNHLICHGAEFETVHLLVSDFLERHRHAKTNPSELHA